jgi:hypothetical protein
LGANDFFVQLLRHARHHPDTRLARWWSERDASPRFDRIRPDGHGVWVDRGRQVGFFLEYDTGSEPLTTLVAKLARYRNLAGTGGPRYPVLFVLPNRTRETNLHRRLAERVDPGVLVATTNPDAGTDPAARVWQVFGYGGPRLPLGELPSDHGQPGPKNPGPPTDADDPLHALQP